MGTAKLIARVIGIALGVALMYGGSFALIYVFREISPTTDPLWLAAAGPVGIVVGVVSIIFGCHLVYKSITENL